MERGSYDLSATGVGIVDADAVLGPSGSARATCWWRWRRPACTPTATRWPATCCSTSAGCSLDGHVEEFGGARSARSCSCRRGSTPGTAWPDRRDRRAELRPHHRRRARPQPGARAAARRGGRRRARQVDAGAGVRPDRGARPGGAAEMEKTFNMGVGMVAVLPPDDVDRALAVLTARHVRRGSSARCAGPRSRRGRTRRRGHGCCCAATTRASDRPPAPTVSRRGRRPPSRPAPAGCPSAGRVAPRPGGRGRRACGRRSAGACARCPR